MTYYRVWQITETLQSLLCRLLDWVCLETFSDLVIAIYSTFLKFL